MTELMGSDPRLQCSFRFLRLIAGDSEGRKHIADSKLFDTVDAILAHENLWRELLEEICEFLTVMTKDPWARLKLQSRVPIVTRLRPFM